VRARIVTLRRERGAVRCVRRRGIRRAPAARRARGALSLGRTRLVGRAQTSRTSWPRSRVARLAGADPRRCRRRSTDRSPCRTGWHASPSAAGVAWFDDSKATNVGAAARSVESFAGPVILLAGGVDKGGGYARSRRPRRGRCGSRSSSARRATRSRGARGGAVAVERIRTLDEAVARAAASPCRRHRPPRARVRELRHVHRLRGARTGVPGRGGGASDMMPARPLRRSRVPRSARGQRPRITGISPATPGSGLACGARRPERRDGLQRELLLRPGSLRRLAALLPEARALDRARHGGRGRPPRGRPDTYRRAAYPLLVVAIGGARARSSSRGRAHARRGAPLAPPRPAQRTAVGAREVRDRPLPGALAREEGRRLATFKFGVLPHYVVVGTIAGLVLLEPDFGTGGARRGAPRGLLFVAGVPARLLALPAIAGLPASPT
jgi:hypothetical protein